MLDKSKLIFRKAFEGELKSVYDLYANAIGKRFCVWNAEYPSMNEVIKDFETDNLFVLVYQEDIIGAISIVPENELDEYISWSVMDEKVREIARVVIDEPFWGLGLASVMVEHVIQILKKDNCSSIHLAVVVNNIPAYKTYLKQGFVVMDEQNMYNNNYYLMEFNMRK